MQTGLLTREEVRRGRCRGPAQPLAEGASNTGVSVRVRFGAGQARFESQLIHKPGVCVGPLASYCSSRRHISRVGKRG